MTSSEFEDRLKDKDIVCIVAEFIARDSIIHRSLRNASQSTRDRYLERAEELIEKYKKFGIKLSAS